MVSPIFMAAGILFFVNMIANVRCVCCPAHEGKNIYDHRFDDVRTDVCDDGTPNTPCCGYGRCNIFCCNCDGGCRVPPSNSPPGLGSVQEEDVFLKADHNKDGFLDKEEARDYLLTHVYGNRTEKMTGFDEGFKKLDKLGKGKLSLADIDVGKDII